MAQEGATRHLQRLLFRGQASARWTSGPVSDLPTGRQRRRCERLAQARLVEPLPELQAPVWIAGPRIAAVALPDPLDAGRRQRFAEERAQPGNALADLLGATALKARRSEERPRGLNSLPLM